MNDIQLHNIDLNLLVIFDVLMEELSVARAADRLGRTPSAVSHSLARLRTTFDDPLMVKVGGRMQPSPKALALIEDVRPVLGNIRRLVRRPESFDPTTSNHVFRIAGAPLSAFVAEVVARVNAAAPNVGIEWIPQTQATYAQVVDEQIDLAFGNAATPLPEGAREEVMPPLTRYVFARRDHPGLDDWSLETWLRWPHVVVALPTTASFDAVERRIASLGLERKVGLRIPDWSGIGDALKRTNMFANQNGTTLLPHLDSGDLAVLEPPVELPQLSMRALWNARLEGDPARAWFREIVIDAMRSTVVSVETRLKDGEVIRAR